MAEERKIKARYKTVGPRTELVSYMKCSIDDTGSLKQERVEEEMETFMVYFPQGHSIRMLGRKALEESGYHLKPRMVDMLSGDVIDVGGDPYDFSDTSAVSLDEQDIEEMGRSKRKAA